MFSILDFLIFMIDGIGIIGREKEIVHKYLYKFINFFSSKLLLIPNFFVSLTKMKKQQICFRLFAINVFMLFEVVDTSS